MSERQPPDIGRQVRTLRRQRGLSLRGLAELCDLSPTTISLIERGDSSPSVATVHRLATALGVPITSFFEEPEARGEVILTRAQERRRLGTEDIQMESLGSGLRGQAMEVFAVTLPPGGGSGNGTIIHAGHELIYCVQGQVEYRIAGKHYLLAAGDALLFEARLPHSWENRSNDPAIFLLVFQTEIAQESVEQHLHP
jgi:transcriptional regulator with XRE-family HTH domain